MKVVIVVEGEDDIKPFTKVFDYEKSNEFIFFNSIDIIKNKISKNLKLNINETLALFTAFVVVSLNNDDSAKKIQEHSSQLLSPNQVLIGVPELLRKLTFSITTDNATDKIIVIKSPIPTEAFVRSLN